MAQPPNYKTHIVSAQKLEELFKQHMVQQKLLQCQPHCTVQPQDPWLDSQRKKELIRYFDPATNDEVAVIAKYTDHPPGTNVQTIILRLRIDNDLYSLRLL